MSAKSDAITLHTASSPATPSNVRVTSCTSNAVQVSWAPLDDSSVDVLGTYISNSHHWYAAITSTSIGPFYCRAQMYAGRVACCPLMCHGEYANETDRQAEGQTDGKTPDRYITHFARRGQRISQWRNADASRAQLQGPRVAQPSRLMSLTWRHHACPKAQCCINNFTN